MGFFKEIFKAFTMSTDEVIAESRKEIANHYMKTEGLHYKGEIYENKVWGIEKECGDVKSIMLFSDRLRFLCEFKNRDLMFKDINDIEILTDTQIEQKSKLGQMMLIGVFALATKPKTEETISRKLVINAIEDEIKFSIIIDTLYDSLTVAKDLNQIIKKYKCGV